MNEIVQRLTEKAGLSPEQAQKALETIAGFVKEKFPMLEGAVDQMFKGGKDDNGNTGGGSGLGGLAGGLGGFGG